MVIRSHECTCIIIKSVLKLIVIRVVQEVKSVGFCFRIESFAVFSEVDSYNIAD